MFASANNRYRTLKSEGNQWHCPSIVGHGTAEAASQPGLLLEQGHEFEVITRSQAEGRRPPGGGKVSRRCDDAEA